MAERYKLKQDIYSGRNKLYGKRNTEVKEVSRSHPVIIVEDKSGERFPVHIENLIKFNQ